MGIDINRVIALTFLLGGVLAGAAALIYGLYNNNTGLLARLHAGLMAFTAAVLGGIGNVNGAALGGFLIGTLVGAHGDVLRRPVGERRRVLAPGDHPGLQADRPARSGDRREGVKDKPPAPKPPTRARSTLGWWYTTTGKAREQRLFGTVIGIAAALLFPLVNSLLGLGWEAKAIPIPLFILLALGLNIVVGFAGLLDLGYAAFFAIGAYTVAFLTSPQSPIPWSREGNR